MEISNGVNPMVSFQEIIQRLNSFWEKEGCLIVQPYDLEKGAGTFNPATFLKVLGPEPWACAYVEPSRRPTDGRYGENPNRLQYYFQYQVIVKPAPPDIKQKYIKSLKALTIKPKHHDIRFIEDDWESPTLGAWGLGWEVWLDGLEITQFTYFQQIGGMDLDPVSVELTYGLERIAMDIQKKDSVFDIEWGQGITYGFLQREIEKQFSKYNFEISQAEELLKLFSIYEKESERVLELGLPLVAYDFVLKCSHLFNLLDARGVLSRSERVSFVARVRTLARKVAQRYLESSE